MVALIFGVLLTPLLVFGCNAVLGFEFLPGNPPFWLLMALAGFFFTVLNRCVDSNRRLMIGGGVARALLCLAVVIIVTAYFTGGAGVAALGGDSYGGRRYIYIGAAIAAYFALVSQRVPPGRTMTYAMVFFISGVTATLGFLIYLTGERWSFLHLIFHKIPPGRPWSCRDLMIQSSAIPVWGGFPTPVVCYCWFVMAQRGYWTSLGDWH